MYQVGNDMLSDSYQGLVLISHLQYLLMGTEGIIKQNWTHLEDPEERLKSQHVIFDESSYVQFRHFIHFIIINGIFSDLCTFRFKLKNKKKQNPTTYVINEKKKKKSTMLELQVHTELSTSF